jgi:hypothetical protein
MIVELCSSPSLVPPRTMSNVVTSRSASFRFWTESCTTTSVLDFPAGAAGSDAGAGLAGGDGTSTLAAVGSWLSGLMVAGAERATGGDASERAVDGISTGDGEEMDGAGEEMDGAGEDVDEASEASER